MEEQNTFIEQMVKRGTAKSDLFHRICLILAALLIIAIPFILGQQVATYTASVVVVIVLLMLMIMWRRAAKEYEYVYTEGTIDIDVIFSSATRKHLFSIDLRKAVCLAPYGSPEAEKLLPGYHFDRTLYACHGAPGEGTYLIIAEYNKKQMLVYFEPDERILQNAIKYSPRTVTVRPEDLIKKASQPQPEVQDEEVL